MKKNVSLTEQFFSARKGDALILSGAAAAARGAFEAGVGFVTTYPGSPITEAFEVLKGRQNSSGICRQSINEHVGFHQAMGFSLAGGRAMITMKHVGFNVASDPAHYIGYTGVRGGMVILVGTDPGATCSTGEYDFRFYSLHTHLPLLEPSNAQEILDAVKIAFAWSEEDNLPYVVAIPASACYGVERVFAGNVEPLHSGTVFTNTPELTNVGRRATENHRRLLDKVSFVEKKARSRKVVKFHPGPSKTLVITSGIHYWQVLESLKMLGVDNPPAVFSPLLTYPFPFSELKKRLSKISEIIFVEDLGGFLETSISSHLLALGKPFRVLGKSVFPPTGNIDFQITFRELGKLMGVDVPESAEFNLPEREGTFCPGCAYRGFFFSLLEELGEDSVIGGDIGCSSLPPHFSSWLTCMNSGTSIAAGVSLAIGKQKKVASLIGDSTLFHSGLQTIIEAAQADSNQLCFVLDNYWTAMTGHQENPSTPVEADGSYRAHVDIEALLRAGGVKRINLVDPTNLRSLRSTIRKLLNEEGFRVAILRRECRLQSRRRPSHQPWEKEYFLVEDRCQECGVCYEKFCCPAIVQNSAEKYEIDRKSCSQCGACVHICPNGAIVAVANRKGPRNE